MRKIFAIAISVSIALAFAAGIAAADKGVIYGIYKAGKDIEDVENAISIGDDTIYGITKNRVWDAEHKVFTHVYSIHNRRILQPLTSEQKTIFDAFQIPYLTVGM
jgi:hypothetical protein